MVHGGLGGLNELSSGHGDTGERVERQTRPKSLAGATQAFPFHLFLRRLRGRPLLPRPLHLLSSVGNHPAEPLVALAQLEVLLALDDAVHELREKMGVENKKTVNDERDRVSKIVRGCGMTGGSSYPGERDIV